MSEAADPGQTTTNPTTEAGTQNPGTTDQTGQTGQTGASSSNLNGSLFASSQDNPTTQAQDPNQTQVDPKPEDIEEFFSRFKGDQAAERKSHMSAQRKITEQAEEIKALREKRTAPEEYQFDEILKETGLGWQGEGDEQKTKAINLFKKWDLPQEAVKDFSEYHASVFHAYAAQFGVPGQGPEELQKEVKAHQERETASLKAQWGDQFESRWGALGKFVNTLPKEVRQAPLEASAAGFDILWKLYEEQKGPALIGVNEAASGLVSEDAIRARMRELNSDNTSKTNTPQGRQMQAELDRLAEQLYRIRSQTR